VIASVFNDCISPTDFMRRSRDIEKYTIKGKYVEARGPDLFLKVLSKKLPS
jgi:hypothetical protein